MRVVAATVLLVAATVVQAADSRMLYHSQTRHGRDLSTAGADTPFNPASVVKVATTLLALDRLGPDHRYATSVGCRGRCTVAEGRLDGNLVVTGGGDPDFQAENAWLVAGELRRKGIEVVSGDLVVEGSFWMGWEHGVEGRETDAGRRALLMGGRLRDAFDPERWNRTHHATWEEFAPRHGLDETDPPRIVFGGEVRAGTGAEGDVTALTVHRSNPLLVVLKRFNTFSNNDLVRVAEPLGGAPAVQTTLRALCGGLKGGIRVTTTSGERSNRMTARQVIRLMWALRDLGEKLGFDPEDVLPVPGCDPGPTERMFPRLTAGPTARTAVVKTGTLTTTDGGVAVLAGFFESVDEGPVAFCVAAPRAGGELRRWRLAEQRWLLDVMASTGGAVALPCGGDFPLSDAFADLEGVDVMKPGGGETSCRKTVEEHEH